jgi:hypothetical protein
LENEVGELCDFEILHMVFLQICWFVERRNVVRVRDAVFNITFSTRKSMGMGFGKGHCSRNGRSCFQIRYRVGVDFRSEREFPDQKEPRLAFSTVPSVVIEGQTTRNRCFFTFSRNLRIPIGIHSSQSFQIVASFASFTSGSSGIPVAVGDGGGDRDALVQTQVESGDTTGTNLVSKVDFTVRDSNGYRYTVFELGVVYVLVGTLETELIVRMSQLANVFLRRQVLDFLLVGLDDVAEGLHID